MYRNSYRDEANAYVRVCVDTKKPHIEPHMYTCSMNFIILHIDFQFFIFHFSYVIYYYYHSNYKIIISMHYSSVQCTCTTLINKNDLPLKFYCKNENITQTIFVIFSFTHFWSDKINRFLCCLFLRTIFFVIVSFVFWMTILILERTH